MNQVKLIYFDGCPNSKHARAALLTAAVGFDVIKQNELPENSPYKKYSSPTILKENQIIFGSESTTPACSSEVIDFATIKRRLKASGSSRSIFPSIGSFGSSFLVGFCPVCIPAIGAFLSSMGLGFLVQQSVLQPLLISFLLIAVAGLFWSYKKEHGKIGPVILGTLMAIAMYVGRYTSIGSTINSLLMWGSIPGIIGATLWNWRLRKTKRCSSCTADK